MKCLPLTLLLLLIAAAAHADVQVRALLEAQQTTAGNGVGLTVEITGAQNVAAPSIPAPDGVAIRYLGPSTQMSIVNGAVSSSVSHRYAVTPTRAGDFTIGPVIVDVGGQRYDAGTVRLQAAAPGAAGAKGQNADAPDVTLELTVPDRPVYLQERIPLTVSLLVGNARVDDLQFPVIETDGFTMDPLPQPTQAEEVRDGRRLRVLRFPTAIVPLRTGEVSLGPARMRMSVVVSRRRGGHSVFDDFFGGDPFADKRTIEVTSTPQSLTVLAWPEQGRPADFTGAVGQFALDVTAQPSEVGVGDPVTIRARVSGSGNLAAAEPPSIVVGNEFKSYPPQVTVEKDAKVFEQALVPLSDAVRQIPAVRFSYLDPTAGRYETLVQGPFPLVVRGGEAPAAPHVVEAPGTRPSAAPLEQLGRDIVYIKDAPGVLRPRGERLHNRGWFAAMQVAPAALFAGCWVFVRRRDRLHADPRYARFVRAGREAQRELANVEKALREGRGEEFDDTVSRLLREYLSAKLDLPLGAVEPESVAQRLGANGQKPAVVQQIGEFFRLLEGLRYTPAAVRDADRQEALRLARAIVEGLEREKGTGRGIGFALLLLAAVAGAADMVDPNTTFYEANGAYRDGRYADAARGYNAVLAAGLESPAIYFNLGNAEMKSGHRGRAIAEYERARRLAPRDADVRANLGLALEDAGVEAEVPVWERIAFPLGERFSTDELAAATAALYWLLMAALAARLWWPRHAVVAGRTALALVAALVVVGTGFGYRLATYDLATAVVVTRSGETPVRFEPSPDGTSHFVASEGSLLRVIEEREGWLQVVRADGRRGWIQADAVEAI